MGQQISKLCQYLRRNNTKVYQQQNSGTLSLHKSKTIINDNSDGYDSDSDKTQKQIVMQIHPKIKWKQGELIGYGSFGRVYKCMDIKTGRILAVKQIELGYVNKESLESFRQEITILSQLQHQNIVAYYGTDEDNRHLSILLEFVGGGSISSILKKFKNQLSESIIQKYVKDILQGLNYLHKKGIIHRDIKGANIIVDTKGVCKLADFGCSIIANQAYSLKGTPNWMAPEVINEEETTRYSDIWSLGCTIIEMLTGQPPWGKFETAMQTLLMISSKKCQPPIPENISYNLKDFLDKCLQLNPQERWKAKDLLKHPFIIQNSKLQSKTETILSGYQIDYGDLYVIPQTDQQRRYEEQLDRKYTGLSKY